MSLIYYASPVYVDHLHRIWISEFGQRTVTKETITKAGASAEVGLAKLLASLADLRGKANLDLHRGKSETLQEQQSVIDRAAALFGALQRKLPSVEEGGDGLCRYSLQTKLESKHRGGDVVIEVSCGSDQVSFSGVTSAAHWSSISLRNNLLMAAAKSQSRTIPTIGLLLPIHSESTSGHRTMQVQFIVIASPEV